MPSYNLVVLMGNLTRDPECRYTPKGTAVCDIGLAINRIYTEDGQKRESCTFVDVTLWGRSAEIVAEYCKKGQPLHVSGRLELDTWDDKQTGQKRSKLKVVGDNIQLLGGKDDAPRGSGGPPERAPQREAPETRRQSQPPKPRDPDLDPEDDIPFRSILNIFPIFA